MTEISALFKFLRSLEMTCNKEKSTEKKDKNEIKDQLFHHEVELQCKQNMLPKMEGQRKYTTVCGKCAPFYLKTFSAIYT